MDQQSASSARQFEVARLLGLEGNYSVLMLDCTKSFREAVSAGDSSSPELKRRFSGPWTGRPDRRSPMLVACSVDGVVVQVFKNLRWRHANKVVPTTGKPTWSFTADCAPEYRRMVGVNVGCALKERGMRNPMFYVTGPKL